jgi:hypothetical protein
MDKSVEDNGKVSQVTLKKSDCLILNPFYVLNRVTDFPQLTEELENSDAQYVVNGLFGNDDFASQVRILLHTNSPITH